MKKVLNMFRNIIKSIEPRISVSGGILEINLKREINVEYISNSSLTLGNKSIVRILGIGPKKIVIQVLIRDNSNILPLVLNYLSKTVGKYNVIVPWRLSNEKYIIASSPTSDDYGNVYFIDIKNIENSGSGTIYKHNLETDKVEVYVSTIPSPSSLFYYDGVLWVTSVNERKLYRVISKENYEVFSQGLGSAYGLAIDSKGGIFVGDQTGNLFKIDYRGRASFYTNIPESFKGYHFAFSPNDDLYFSVPSNMGMNYIYRIKNGHKNPEVFLKTYNILGGVSFSKNGDFFWAENTRDEGIVFVLDKKGIKRKIMTGSFLVGLNLDLKDNIIVNDVNYIYRVFKKWIEN